MWTPAKFSFMQSRVGGTWRPTALGTALKLWLDASDSATITITGSGVSTWADKSGNGNNATQSTDGSRPPVASAVQNGKDAIDFEPVDHLILPDFVSGFSACSFVGIGKIAADPPPSTINSGPMIFTTSESVGQHWPFTDGIIYDGFASTARKTVGDPTPSLAAWHLISIRSAASDWEFHLNGTSLFSTGTNTVGITTMPTIAQGFGSGAYWDGYIGEIILTNSALSTVDRQKAEGYLAHRWAITSVLDAGHPYKNVAP
jgi:hypothetical protein